MKVIAIGTGYVGLVTGACLVEMGDHVVCLDVDERRHRVLDDGGMPIHEPGLKEIVQRNKAAGRLQFTTDLAAAVSHGTPQFIGVGTPPDGDGSADLEYVLAAAASIGRHMTDCQVIVDESTVPVGVQAEHRRQARGAEPGDRERADPARRAASCLRPGRDGRGPSRVRWAGRAALRAAGGRHAAGRGRAGRDHRVEGVPQPGLRRHQGGAEAAGDLRRRQSLRPGADADGGIEYHAIGRWHTADPAG